MRVVATISPASVAIVIRTELNGLSGASSLSTSSLTLPEIDPKKGSDGAIERDGTMLGTMEGGSLLGANDGIMLPVGTSLGSSLGYALVLGCTLLSVGESEGELLEDGRMDGTPEGLLLPVGTMLGV